MEAEKWVFTYTLYQNLYSIIQAAKIIQELSGMAFKVLVTSECVDVAATKHFSLKDAQVIHLDKIREYTELFNIEGIRGKIYPTSEMWDRIEVVFYWEETEESDG